MTQIDQINVNEKNLKCVNFWMEFGWFLGGHKLDLMATFWIFTQHNTAESQSAKYVRTQSE